MLKTGNLAHSVELYHRPIRRQTVDDGPNAAARILAHAVEVEIADAGLEHQPVA